MPAYITEVFADQVQVAGYNKVVWYVRNNGEKEALVDAGYDYLDLEDAVKLAVKTYYPDFVGTIAESRKFDLIMARTRRSIAVRKVANLQQELATARQELAKATNEVADLDF